MMNGGISNSAKGSNMSVPNWPGFLTPHHFMRIFTVADLDVSRRGFWMRMKSKPYRVLLMSVVVVILATAPLFGQAKGVALPESMVLVEGGTFQMGDTFTVGLGHPPWEPVHSVTVSSFYVGKYVVLQKEYRDVMGTDPSNFKGDDLPVETVSWYDAAQYCNKLSEKNGMDPCYTINGTNVTCDFSKNGFRLPTEAEWEFAAKGGIRSAGYKYAGGNSVDAVGWYSGNSGNHPHPVGQKQANELGLYDMSGNVWEWCNDWYGGYGSSAQTNPRGPDTGPSFPFHVVRGGSWFNNYLGEAGLRTAFRSNFAPEIKNSRVGFRLVRRSE